MQDEDEFENAKDANKQQVKEPTVLNVPLPRRGRIEAYVAEIIMMAAVSLYFLNYLSGRSKNIKLAQTWLDVHKDLLETNFSLMGDDGQTKEPANDAEWQKQAEHIYSMWCSGRLCCEGMLIELRFIKRQCLIHSIAQLFKPQSDKVIIKCTMDRDATDTFVLAFGTKKSLGNLHKEMTDLGSFCGDKKKGEIYGLPAQFQVLSEIHEAAETVIDGRMLKLIEQYEGLIDYVHVSDQFSGTRTERDQNVTSKFPDTETIFTFCFNIPGHSAEEMANMRPLLQYCLFFIDRYARIRLSREAKSKADRNRQKIIERYQKEQHALRQEEAQKKREEKIRQEKEKIMEMDDDRRQYKMEARQQKKEMKKRQKGKVMKVKM